MFEKHSPLGTLPSGWKLEKLKNLSIKIGSGSTPRGGESAYLEALEEFAFVRSQNVLDYHFSEKDIRFISDSDAKKLKNVHLEVDDILLNITGDGITFSRACIIPNTVLPAAVNQHVAIIRLDQSKCLPGYLLAYLCLPKIKNYVANFNAGGSRRAITKAHIEAFEIPLAPICVQETIQKVTFDFINKIEANKKVSQTLQEIAHATFKSWFIDFDPTRAKIAAKQNGEDPELAAMSLISGKSKDDIESISPENREKFASTAALFTDSLVNSELGEIPAGWEIKLNGELMDVRDGTHDSPKKSEHGYPLITSKHITSGTIDTKDAYLISENDFHKVNKRSKVNQGDILLTMIGTVGIPCLVSQPDINFAIKNIGLFKTSENQVLKNYFYLLLKSKTMKDYLAARMAGTTQKYLSLKALRNIELVLPPVEILEKFDATIAPLMDNIYALTLESKTLSDIRDSILPKLFANEDIEKTHTGS